MPLNPGSQLGPYQITGPLGSGGMGEVYRARDARLNRDVAIKVVPDLFASDPERLARFSREAQALAALNHPNIAQIHGLEESGGVRALVMELVEGDDLSAHVARGPMPLADALPIARQIADALEAAHEQGIIHRDLKPANIKVRADGTVKLLDFGLARAAGPGTSSGVDVTNSPTLLARATQMGMIVGTAAYMSPEQARGRGVDRRADIWAFGAVLYEMLTGRRAFDGDDISLILANVLKEEPDWQALPADLPAPLRRLLRRCLEKDPRRRLSSIGDARLELDETDPAAIGPAAGPPPGSRRRAAGLPMLLGIAALSVAATAAGMRLLAPAPGPAGPGGVTRLAVALPEGEEVGDTNRIPLALSPDGRVLVYVGLGDGTSALRLRRLSERDAVLLPGTEGAVIPFFSPDGQWIAFFAQGRLKRIAVMGAALQVVCEDAPDPRGGAWGVDGNIYFAPANTTGLWKVPATGGTPTELTRPDHARGEVSHRWPHVLPDGDTLLFTIWTGPGADERRIVAQSLATGARHDLVPGGDTPRYLSTGYLLYGRLDNLFAVPWRPGQADSAGVVPLSFTEHPRLENEGAAAYAVSDRGTLAYLQGGAARYAQRVLWIDREGRMEPLPLPERDYESVTISPDGRRAILQINEGSVGLWLYDFSRHTLTPLVTGRGSSQAPVWTPDGRRIIYRATRSGQRNLYWKAADGTGEEEPLTTLEGVTHTPTSVSPDGRWVLFSEQGAPGRGTTLQKLRLDGDRTSEPAITSPSRALNGQVSPDGRWLAYVSNVSGRAEVYVQPFPGPGPSSQISVGGGNEPLWSRSGRELFYLGGGRLMAVDIATGSALVTGTPRVVMEGRFRANSNANTAYDVSEDGLRFLRIQQAQPVRAVDRIDVVLNWGDEVKRLAAAK